MRVDARHAAAVLALAAAAALAWAATRNTGPIPQARYSEDLAGPLMEHMVSEAEQITQPVLTQHRYPRMVAPAISSVIQQGYTPLYQIPDPQVAALPAEQAW